MVELILKAIDQVDKKLIDDFSCIFQSYKTSDLRTREDHLNIDHYLKEHAFSDHVNNYVKTHVLLDLEKKKVIGYFSLFNDQVEISQKKRRSFEYKRYYIYRMEEIEVYPSVNIHQFALDSSYQSQLINKIRYSEVLMGHLFDKALHVTSASGCMFITLESTENAQGFYENYGFRILKKKTPLTLPIMIFRIADLKPEQL